MTSKVDFQKFNSYRLHPFGLFQRDSFCQYIFKPHEQAIDLPLWCRILPSVEVLASLSSSCPRLQSIRIGANGCKDNTAIAKALEGLLPVLPSQKDSDEVDDWETASEGGLQVSFGKPACVTQHF